MFFTVEETNLMCCFDTSSRKRLIAEMKSLPINELDDEMAELLFHTVRKLEGITGEAFAQLYIARDRMMDYLKVVAYARFVWKFLSLRDQSRQVQRRRACR